ncbi:hypothetical protein ACFQL1_22725 [Halomicroarcula sp. GCM10025709]|uniref:hypothetical protein n=1 Tax=Haloarcula TaxID=2237 RepID=UPI0024C2A663|nr:hypothetical protein [Halomicroarcula sp. YJ-61-S]
MHTAHWESLGGTQLRYRDQTWELTGDIEARETGETLAVEARQVDDVRHETATLYFDLQGSTESLNPGNLGAHFDRFERDGDDHYIVVTKEQRRYRYKLHRLEPH